jgi:hypothetical protein
MAYSARVLKDSISDCGVRLTTLEITLPRIVLAEFNTHRVFSRNSASSRAIPVEKMLKRVKEDPFIPIYWGKNQKGMQADIELSLAEQQVAEIKWLEARDSALRAAEELLTVGVHKQITNRLLEPFLWQTILVTSTEWNNWDALRRHKDAQPEIKFAADIMYTARQQSIPKLLNSGEWHLPLTPELDDVKGNIDWNFWKKVSTGRCARVSHLTHDGKRDPEADILLGNRLQESGHMSPFEHVARPLDTNDLKNYEVNPQEVFRGNFRGWFQYRKELPCEQDYGLMLSAIEEVSC